MWYWQIKTFTTREAMEKWLKKREGKIIWDEVFINNGYGIEWKSIRVIDI